MVAPGCVGEGRLMAASVQVCKCASVQGHAKNLCTLFHELKREQFQLRSLFRSDAKWALEVERRIWLAG